MLPDEFATPIRELARKYNCTDTNGRRQVVQRVAYLKSCLTKSYRNAVDALFERAIVEGQNIAFADGKLRYVKHNPE